MTRKKVLPILAFLGALLGLFIVFWTQRTPPSPPIFAYPPQPPYTLAIAGSGIIEASSENISIGTPFSEIVDQIFVIEGDYVKKGDPLFQLDLRNFIAQANVAKASLKAALTDLENKALQFSFYENLKDKEAVSKELYEQYRYAYLGAIDSVDVAKNNLAVAETDIQRSIICAPIDGKILQVNIHVGELASPILSSNTQNLWGGSSQGNLVVMGTVEPMQVRVDIDEDDAWHYTPGSAATAYVRGNSRIHFPLTFHLVEPYIIPKSSFTGEVTERVDTRVLQVLYTFEKRDLPVYVGQVLDIYIDASIPAPEAETSSIQAKAS